MQQSPWWPEGASDVGAYATTIASFVTLLLFVIALRQLRLLRTQVDVASREMEAAQVSAKAAQMSAEAAIEAAREAARTRVDAYSPRLIVSAQAVLGAWVDPTRFAMPAGGEPKLLDERSIQLSRKVSPGEEFIFDRDSHVFIYFRMVGSVRNEGSGTGRVRLDTEARFDDADYGQEIVLKPDEVRAFEWRAGFPASVLADRREKSQPAREFLTVTGMSYEDKGVIDHVHLELASRSLQEVPGHKGAFTLVDQMPEAPGIPSTVVTVYPLQRTYRWDWNQGNIQPPPWPKDDDGHS